MKSKIREIYESLLGLLKEDKERTKISFSEFITKNPGKNQKEEKIISFYSLLYLENQKKIWLEQENPFGEIYVWQKKIFLKYNPHPFADLNEDSGEDELEKTIKKAGIKKKIS